MKLFSIKADRSNKLLRINSQKIQAVILLGYPMNNPGYYRPSVTDFSETVLFKDRSGS